MLVHADGVEAHLGRELELIHEVVVHVMRSAWVEQRRMDVDPHRGMLLVEIVGKLCVRHQVKPHELHAASSPDSDRLGKRSFTSGSLPRPEGRRNVCSFPDNATLLLFPCVIRIDSYFVHCNLATATIALPHRRRPSPCPLSLSRPVRTRRRISPNKICTKSARSRRSVMCRRACMPG